MESFQHVEETKNPQGAKPHNYTKMYDKKIKQQNNYVFLRTHVRTFCTKFVREKCQTCSGTHLCNLCVDTRWLAHVLRDLPDVSHGAGGLLQVGGPVADALWLQGFGVALLTLCLVVGGKQKKETKITISTRKKNEHSMPSSSRVHRTETHTVLRVCATARLRQFGSSAAVSSCFTIHALHHGFLRCCCG